MDGFANAGFEGVGGDPAEFALDFSGVDGIAAVVAGAVFDKGDEFAGLAAEFGGEFVHEVADQFDDADVGPFVVAADVVGFAEFSTGEDLPEGFGVVAHIEPIADVHAVAVHGDGLARADFFDDDGDEFFRKLERAVVVGAIGGDDGQAVRVMIGADQHVARGFAGGVWGVGRVRRGLGEEAGVAEGAVHFVGGNVVEFWIADFGFRIEPQLAAGFEQVEGADDVGADEIAGAGDGAIDMGFGGEMQHVADGVFFHDLHDGGFVAQINIFKSVFRMVRDARDVFQMTGVGQAIEVDEAFDLRAINDVMDQVRSDKARAAGDE